MTSTGVFDVICPTCKRVATVVLFKPETKDYIMMPHSSADYRTAFIKCKASGVTYSRHSVIGMLR